WDGTAYPDMIRNMPEIDIPVDGIRGWLLSGNDKQVIFFDIQPVGKIPPHSHCNQWGIVLEGKMSLTIGDETKTYRKGDWYYIPKGVVHSADFISRVNVIDVFDAPDRYSTK
ncbi:MAG: cupin domain-containing protein, partial [candidate division Zixibacteria bacterium]|nr:cupin domain-containing protein [candidate division Zixibacteria bacterium]